MSSYRSKKAGIGLQIQKKMEARYDEEEAVGTPRRVMEWINKVLEGEHPLCTGAPTWRRLSFWLRDGTGLCKLINKLRVAAGQPPIKYGHNALTAFIAMENIAKFNEAVKDYGLPEEALFQSVDLYECQKGPFVNVINCLNLLGFEANKKGFSPAFEFVESKTTENNDMNHTS